MNVNVIVPWNLAKTKGLKQGAIHRMAGYLREIDGWDISGGLDPAADVNYVFGYGERWKFEEDPWAKYRQWAGSLAGYFTHREPYGIKYRLWEQAAETVALRVAQSAQAARLLGAYGATEQAMLPVEREAFCPKDRAEHARPLIGVSGYCPISGRKGNALVYDLAHYPPARNWRIVAAGRNWPVPTTMYRWSDLPQFYQALDIYLCASLFEGGPLGVFEALSCGVPVVIPRGVGALDELPRHKGIYRYARGNFDDMFGAVEKAARHLGEHDKARLRAITEHMTVERFCADHVRIFEQHFGQGRTR